MYLTVLNERNASIVRHFHVTDYFKGFGSDNVKFSVVFEMVRNYLKSYKLFVVQNCRNYINKCIEIFESRNIKIENVNYSFTGFCLIYDSKSKDTNACIEEINSFFEGSLYKSLSVDNHIGFQFYGFKQISVLRHFTIQMYYSVVKKVLNKFKGTSYYDIFELKKLQLEKTVDDYRSIIGGFKSENKQISVGYLWFANINEIANFKVFNKLDYNFQINLDIILYGNVFKLLKSDRLKNARISMFVEIKHLFVKTKDRLCIDFDVAVGGVGLEKMYHFEPNLSRGFYDGLEKVFDELLKLLYEDIKNLI